MFNIHIENFHSHFFEKNIFFQKAAIAEEMISWDCLTEVLYGWGTLIVLKCVCFSMVWFIQAYIPLAFKTAGNFF